jgi:hypothetical protein
MGIKGAFSRETSTGGGARHTLPGRASLFPRISRRYASLSPLAVPPPLLEIGRRPPGFTVAARASP